MDAMLRSIFQASFFNPMNRFLRHLVLWLVMLTVPIQGLASMSMPSCHLHAPDHAETSTHPINGDDHTLVSQDHEQQMNDSAAAQHDSSSHDHQVHSSAKNNCCASHGGTSCSFMFPQSFSFKHAAFPSDRYLLSGEPLYSGFTPNVATRPPVTIRFANLMPTWFVQRI